MKLDNDNRERMKSLLSFFLEFYKIIMGTLLLIFIPQSCGDHSCSINENIYAEGLFRNITKIYNLFTLVIVSGFYIIELKRENWCIEYLDIDANKPINNLDQQIEKYPSIKSDMNKLNNLYFKLTLGSMISVCVNVILSCVYIIPNNYGTNTYTSLISFGLLVLLKLFNSYNISRQSIHEEHAYSAFMKTPITFNTIDKNYVIQDIGDDGSSNSLDEKLVSSEEIKVDI